MELMDIEELLTDIDHRHTPLDARFGISGAHPLPAAKSERGQKVTKFAPPGTEASDQMEDQSTDVTTRGMPKRKEILRLREQVPEI